MISSSIRQLSSSILKRRVISTNSVTRSYVYRALPGPAPRWNYIVADCGNAFLWWWILVHCWYQWDHIVGEFEYPDPEKWTNEQLGISAEEL